MKASTHFRAPVQGGARMESVMISIRTDSTAPVFGLVSFTWKISSLLFTLWTLFMNAVTSLGGKPRQVRTSLGTFQKGDVVGVFLDLSVPQISFSVNGLQVKGFFRDFNLEGMFFPVISVSSKVRYDVTQLHSSWCLIHTHATKVIVVDVVQCPLHFRWRPRQVQVRTSRRVQSVFRVFASKTEAASRTLLPAGRPSTRPSHWSKRTAWRCSFRATSGWNDKCKQNLSSHTGNRTRAAGVKGRNPNH